MKIKSEKKNLTMFASKGFTFFFSHIATCLQITEIEKNILRFLTTTCPTTK